MENGQEVVLSYSDGPVKYSGTIGSAPDMSRGACSLTPTGSTREPTLYRAAEWSCLYTLRCLYTIRVSRWAGKYTTD